MTFLLSRINPALRPLATPTAVMSVVSSVAALGLLMAGPASAQSRRGMGPVEIGSPVPVSGGLSEQDHAYSATRSGRILPLGQLLQTATPIGRGKYIGVEPDISNSVYRFKFVRPSGNVVWVDVDGRTGHVLAARH